MVKFLATSPDGRQMLGIGLVRGNVARLTEGLPIHFSKEELGVRDLRVDDIVIFFGETEQAIETEFREKGFVSAETIVNRDPLGRH